MPPNAAPAAPATPATPAAPATPQKTAANVAQGVQNRAQGQPPAAKGPDRPDDGDERGRAGKTADPNAGKQKVVVEGKEYWLTPQQIAAYAQKGIAFEPRVSELDRIKREVAQFEQALITNPGAIIANIAKKSGKPIAQLVQGILSSNASDEVKEATGQWYWENVAKRQRMDPKDREILEKDERIKSLEEETKQRQSAALAQENKARIVKALGEVSAQIKETLGELGITNLDGAAAIRLTKEIADVMRVSYFSKQPCTAKQAAQIVRQRILDYQKQFYDELDMDKLVEVLGKENAEKVRKHFLKLVKQNEDGEQKPAASGRPARRNERQTINSDQFRDYLDEIKRTGSVPGKQ